MITNSLTREISTTNNPSLCEVVQEAGLGESARQARIFSASEIGRSQLRAE
jgi:hypothetical protein